MIEAYPDAVSQMSGTDLLSPRVISNAVARQDVSISNDIQASDYLWQWGQFLDHDIDLTGSAEPQEPANMSVPAGDPFFDPMSTGTQVIIFDRSIYDTDTGIGTFNPRQQLNQITGWIDASQVYGSDPTRGRELRTLDSTGRLKTSEGDLLPFNVAGLPNAGGPGSDLFLAGDVRANEQVALTAMHTLFVREHNRLAGEIAARNPSLDGEEIYQRARRIVGAQMQVITYKEFLPVLLGQDALSSYSEYDSSVDARIMNEFSTAAFRFGHSMLNEQLKRLDEAGQEIDAGHLALSDAFFAPQEIIDHGIEPVLRGLAVQASQAVDVFVTDAVRNFLFGPPGAGGFDLVALNIQRGRDHGMPSYNQMRIDMRLTPAQTFADVSSDPDIQARLASVYVSVDKIEAWVGVLAEDHVPGAMVGDLALTMLKEQFEVLRDGDSFWYARYFQGVERSWLEATRLADIIRRNTTVDEELPDDVFHLPDEDG